MGWKDIFSNASEWDPNDLMNGGILGASMMAQARKQAEERSKRPKPGKLCNNVCVINDDRCSPCLALQEQLEQELTRLEQMEELAELSFEQIRQVQQESQITKCSFCGAPYEAGHKACPYCDTAYPAGRFDFDILYSKHERQDQLMKQAEATWAVYLQLYVLTNQYTQDTAGSDMMGYIQKFVGKAGNAMRSYMSLSAAELKQGAKYYGVSISQHIYGIMTGEMKTIKMIQMETQYR